MDHSIYVEKDFPKDNRDAFGLFDVPNKKPKDSEVYFTDDLNGCVKVRKVYRGKFGETVPTTLHTLFMKTVQERAYSIALCYKYNMKDQFMELTYSQYYRLAIQVTKSIIQLGIEERNAVCIVGFNCVPWMLSYYGVIFANCIASGIYTTNNMETVRFIMNNCSCQLCIVEDDAQLKKYIEAAEECQSVKAFVQWNGELNPETVKLTTLKVMKWSEFMDLGKSVSNDDVFKRLLNITPNECCSLIYTSGTTGPPKGVMLSHDNLTFMATVFSDNVEVKVGKDVILSYLPLSHIAAQLCDLILPVKNISAVYFAQPDAMKGSLGVSLHQVCPTQFFGVPRVYEKIMEQMKDVGASVSGLKKSIATWAKDIGLRHNFALMEKRRSPIGSLKLFLADTMVFSKVRRKIGLNRCKVVYCAAAPIHIDTLNYFASLNIIILELYGMSETCGPHTFSKLEHYLFSSVGACPHDFEIHIRKENHHNNGEILMGGRNCFMGYCNSMEKTQEIFNEENYIKSGDIGHIHNDLLFITGRIKDLIITAGGENIAPVPIECKIKSAIPFVSNVLVIGDKRKFLSCLLTVMCKMDSENQYPTDALAPTVTRWCEENDYTTHDNSVNKFVSDMNSAVVKAVEDGLKLANDTAVSKAATIQKWKFLAQDFSLGDGDLTPTLKVKRNVVVEKHAAIIDSLYEE